MFSQLIINHAISNSPIHTALLHGPITVTLNTRVILSATYTKYFTGTKLN